MKKKNIIGIIAGILLFIITTIFIVILKKIDVIPDKYFITDSSVIVNGSSI